MQKIAKDEEELWRRESRKEEEEEEEECKEAREKEKLTKERVSRGNTKLALGIDSGIRRRSCTLWHQSHHHPTRLHKSTIEAEKETEITDSIGSLLFLSQTSVLLPLLPLLLFLTIRTLRRMRKPKRSCSEDWSSTQPRRVLLRRWSIAQLLTRNLSFAISARKYLTNKKKHKTKQNWKISFFLSFFFEVLVIRRSLQRFWMILLAEISPLVPSSKCLRFSQSVFWVYYIMQSMLRGWMQLSFSVLL